jgi:hypothetical protein
MDILRFLVSLLCLFVITGVFTLVWTLIIQRVITFRTIKPKVDLDVSHLVKKKVVEPYAVNAKHVPKVHSDADLYEREKNPHNK